MGRLTRAAAKRAKSGPTSLATVRAQRELLARGVVVSRRELGDRSLADCIDACNWAVNGRPLALRPRWIARLLEQGRARLRRGVCRSCGCTQTRGCAPRCFWVPTATPPRTLCSSCDPAFKGAAALLFDEEWL